MCSLTKEPKKANEIVTQTDSRSKYCYNCFVAINYNSPEEPLTHEDFQNQIFCSKRCLKIQYLENSTFCKNENCEKGYFVKFMGVLSEGNWYCSKTCLTIDTESLKHKDSMKKSNYSMKLSRDESENSVGVPPGLYNSMINEATKLDREDKQCCEEEILLDNDDLFGDESYASLEVDMDFDGSDFEENIDLDFDCDLVKSILSK